MKLNSVDVVMCTWNSNKPYFERCLKSVRREIPVHHFIIIDRYSTDGTVNVIKKYFEPIVVQSKENLARARLAGIKLVDTEYFVFVDSDIELSKGWFQRLTSYINDRVGAVHERTCYASIYPPRESKFVRWASKHQDRERGLVIDVTKKNASEYRGDPSNAIVKNVLKDYDPSSIVSAYEDYLLKEHVINKGYIWRILCNYSVKHYTPRNLTELLRRIRWNTAGARVMGLESSLKRLLAQHAAHSALGLMESIKYREPRIFPYLLYVTLIRIDAYLRWNKFRVVERD